MAAIVPFPGGDATLGIVAGGKARRLSGLAKGLLVYQGRTFLERLLDLRPLFAEVLLGTNDAAPYARFGLGTVADAIVDRGAPGGVHALLAAARTPWLLAVAADMPFVAQAAVEALLAARSDGADAVCFEVSGRLQPLLAVYRAEIARAWGEALAAGPSFGKLLSRFQTTVLPERALALVDPSLRSVEGVNTRLEAERWGVAFACDVP